MTHRFIGGVWLEAAIFGMISDIFEGTSVEVYGGLKLAVKDTRIRSMNVPPSDMELDIAFLIDGQLHVVEVKAVTTPKGFGQFTPKLVKMREEIGSHRMRTFLITPFLEQMDIEVGDFMSRTKQQGIELYYGYNEGGNGRAINRLNAKLDEMKNNLQ